MDTIDIGTIYESSYSLNIAFYLFGNYIIYINILAITLVAIMTIINFLFLLLNTSICIALKRITIYSLFEMNQSSFVSLANGDHVHQSLKSIQYPLLLLVS